MKTSSSIINHPLTLLLRRLLIALLALSVARLVFWIFNANQFGLPSIGTVFQVALFGFYYDFISLFYCLSPFLLLHIIPGGWFYNSSVQKGLRLFFVSIVFILITLTFIDAGYFPFSKSRLSITLFKMAGEEEISILKYMADYWFFIPIILAVTYFSYKLYPLPNHKPRLKWYIQAPLNLIFLALVVLTIRGGMRLKPLRSIDTALFVSAQYSPLVISTGFNFLESLNVENIEIPNYLSSEALKLEMAKDYHQLNVKGELKKKNIVILILESFGKEYTFPERGISYTPFLQQLAKQSEFYTHSYSNGTRSVDAIPAILEGVPKLTATDFMYTNYIQNTTPGFPMYLANQGYTCHFFHGGKNGTMGFEAFLKSRGWNYYGKNEYTGKPEDFDGQWGIFDAPYLAYFKNQLDEMKQPFVASVFTLSSHHPYTLPTDFKDSFKTIKQPIHKTIKYTDNCLRQFFESAKNEAWYKETIFILTGDHSGENFTKRYQSHDGRYEVPILVFDPSQSQGQFKDAIVQHIDILPMALERLGYQGKIFTMGTYFDSTQMAFQNEDGIYQAITKDYIYTFDGSKFKFKATTKTKEIENTAWYEMALKAKIQNYNFRMVNNQFY